MKKLLCMALLGLSSLAYAEVSLKLLTWNTFMIPKPINLTFQKTRSKLIANTLKQTDYDVMLFQENFTGNSRREIGGALKQTHPYQARLGGQTVRMNAGLFLVSRHPMKILEKIHFKHCTTSDCLAAKGSFLVEITLPEEKKVQIATTHLQAWNTDKARAVRVKQLEEIKAMMDRHAKPSIPQVLAGDINVDGRLEHEYNNTLNILDMQSEELEGDLRVTNGFEVSCYNIPAVEEGGEWLDHVFINPQQTRTMVTHKKVVPFYGEIKGENCPLSDHYAVEATITF